MSYGNTLFRITVWPGQPFSLPDSGGLPIAAPAREATKYRLTPSGGLVAETATATTQDELGEVYLRLSQVDLGDPEAILDFVNQYGVLGAAYSQTPFLGQRSGPDPRLAFVPPWVFPAHQLAQKELEGARRAAERDVEFHWEIVETIAEFRIAAQLLGDLTTAWRLLTGSAEVPEWESSIAGDRMAIDIRREGVQLRLSPKDRAAYRLDIYLPELLHPFHPRLQLFWEDGTQWGEPLQDITLFWLCALELYNHIAENARYRRCENDRCHSLYVRHAGRAEHGQHRTTATKYCSAQCARAVAQRRYRARRRNA